ncbi:MAG TPA: alkaline phosphatase family protein [Solirubrobacteraceae bacterium]|nr:alkaline phosphatase family protein [Solirubrobacteraceae bacterium]
MLLLAILSCFVIVGAATATIVAFDPFGTEQVEGTYANGVLLPTNQWVSPLGTRLFQDNARLLTSSISPNGEYLAALTWKDYDTTLTIWNLETKTLASSASIGNGAYDTSLSDPYANDDASVSPDGPLWSADGSTIWVPQTDYVDKFSFNAGTATQTNDLFLCGEGGTNPLAAGPDCDSYGPGTADGSYIPSGMALSPDGSKLYVAFNGANTLGVIDTATDTLVNQIKVGNAPRQVVISANGNTAYVSNEGGRPANRTDFTNLSDGTPIVSSDVTGAATTGTVSVVNLTSGHEIKEIPVGLQPTALYQDGSALFVANSNDDSMSVINERTDSVAQTVTTNPVPGATVGSYANAISMSDANTVLVSIGRDNAIAVYRYGGLNQRLRFEGLLPTDWYPVQVQPDPALGAGKVVVTNDKGIGASGPESSINEGADTSKATGHNTYDDTGSITEFTMPNNGVKLAQATSTVFRNNAWNQIKPIDQGAYDTVPSVIPKRLGQPSPIKHIVVIVKENRSYDQVLGDLDEGNGDAALAQFGQEVTPNAHALATRFGDLDNFYDEGTLSADGHNWIVQAEANDYLEKEFGAFYRSYPSQGGDALAYQRDGFLWNAAEKAGVSVQNFGEYIFNPYNLPADSPDWSTWYAESQWLEDGHQGTEPISDPCQYTKVQSDIPSLQAISAPCFPNFQLTIPDQYRVDQWLPYFQHDEQTGQMPQLTFMWLMTDHTTGSGTPDPVAQVADNDLAVGRVVDEISHSKFWKSTAIFVDEDDTQNGVDHVDGHRAPTLVISPYSQTGVDDQYYSQLNMVRTVEQILGIKPMNQEDGSAEPMYSAFTKQPDLAPYNLVQNIVPLNLGAPGGPTTFTPSTTQASAITKADPKSTVSTEGVIPAAAKPLYDAWKAWLAKQAAAGRFNGPDRINAEQLNRYDWYSAHDWSVAYPGDREIFLPDQVPGHSLPAALIGN